MIGIIGIGNMGGALALRIKQRILISDINSDRLHSIKRRHMRITRDSTELARRSRVIILAVKPQHIPGVLKGIRPFVNDRLIISIAAGVKTTFIEKLLGRPRVVRAMPNMPAMVGKGISAITAGRFARKTDLNMARKILLNIGEVVSVEEGLMDAVTALSGSGPAYYFLFTDILTKAGLSCGLRKGLAVKLARAAFIGAAYSAAATSISMQDFVKKVASKGGTTEAALKVFKQKGLEHIVKQAVRAACARSHTLNK